MLGWGTVASGAVISALLATAGVFLFANERRGRVALTAGFTTGLAVAGWDAVLEVTHAREMFAAATLSAFPVSWQDGGCGVTALAATMVVLGCGLRRGAKAVHLVLIGLL